MASWAKDVSHDEAFEGFRARREAERAANIKVTWRKVSPLTGGGWSGLGPDGALVYVGEAQPPLGFHSYGRIVDGTRRLAGGSPTLAGAKRAAESLFTTNGGTPVREEARMAPASPILEARAIKIREREWQPAVFVEGSEEPLQKAEPVRTKKEAEGIASTLLEAVAAQARKAAERPERPSEAAMREAAQHDAPRDEVDPAPTVDSLVEGLEGGKAVPNPRGTYHRISVGGRSLAYANPRKDGVLLDFAAKTVEGAHTPGLQVKGNRVLLKVNARNLAEVRAFLERLERK